MKAIIIAENREIEVRKSTLSNIVYVDIATGISYFFGELKFL
jgi:hypothetical protein